MKSSSQWCPFRESPHILEATAGLLGAPTQVLQGTGGMDTPSSLGGGGGGLTGQACPRSLGEGVPTGALGAVCPLLHPRPCGLVWLGFAWPRRMGITPTTSETPRVRPPSPLPTPNVGARW